MVRGSSGDAGRTGKDADIKSEEFVLSRFSKKVGPGIRRIRKSREDSVDIITRDCVAS